MRKKIHNFLILRELHLNSWHYFVSIKKRMLVIGSQCVNKQPEILHNTKRGFFQINYVESN